MTEYESAGAARAKWRRPMPVLRVELSPVEQVAIVGALQRDLKLPDVDHDVIQELLVRLLSS